MKKLLAVFCLIALATFTHGQGAQNDIKGTWRYFESLQDTVNKATGGLYFGFNDTTMVMLSGASGTLTPLGGQEKYSFSNDTLITFPPTGETKVKVSFLSPDLITYINTGEKKTPVYLRREKK